MTSDFYNAIAASVVRIETPEGYSSGVSVEQGILTCAHAVGSRRSAKVGWESFDGSIVSVKARVLCVDSHMDLALLSREDCSLDALPIAVMDLSRYAHIAVAACPDEELVIVAPGVYQSTSRGKKTESLFYGLVSSGSSGGALVSDRGEIVGIIKATIKMDRKPIALGLAVAREDIERFLVRAKCTLSH